MVQSGLSKKLIDILATHNKKDVDTKIQHAVLSTLRHLSIPAQNKSKLIEENIVEVLYGMINNDYYPVIFKLMGTFRMLVDGQEASARALINKKEFIEKIIYWCYNSDHLGVRAEAPRLLVWLIKNSRSSEAYPIILSVSDSMKCLVDMISSLHTVMQNEAIIAITLISSYYFCSNDNKKMSTTMSEPDATSQLNNSNSKSHINSEYLADLLIAADIAKNVEFIIKKYHEKIAFETASNLVKLLSLLSNSIGIIEHFKNCKINDALTLLEKNKKIKELSSDISVLKTSFDGESKNEEV
ncbi:hypothetical protein QE152_g7005 [Popillia japonica]